MVVIQSTTHKHLGMLFDIKLDFQEHLKDKRSKINKTVVLLTELKKYLLDLHYVQYISLLLNSILVMVKSYMTKHIILHFIKSRKKFSIIQRLQWQEL